MFHQRIEFFNFGAIISTLVTHFSKIGLVTLNVIGGNNIQSRYNIFNFILNDGAELDKCNLSKNIKR